MRLFSRLPWLALALLGCTGTDLSPKEQSAYDGFADRLSTAESKNESFGAQAEATFKEAGEAEKKADTLTRSVEGCGLSLDGHAFGVSVENQSARVGLKARGERARGCLPLILEVSK